jgi:hypothetical protein
MSELFNFNVKDFVKGAVVAILSAVVATLQSIITQKGFNLTSTDGWFIASVAVTAFLGYLLKNFLSDVDGKVLGKY